MGEILLASTFEIPNTHETLNVLNKTPQRNILKNKNLVRQFSIFFMVQVMPQKSDYEMASKMHLFFSLKYRV